MNVKSTLIRFLLIAAIVVAGSGTLFAATLCVDQRGGSGCYTTISAAVAAAAPGDTVRVAAGRYGEDVVIPKAIFLVGHNQHDTIIDATGLPHGIDIDGHGHAGLSDVFVTGFSVQNANFSGILVSNASAVRLSSNNVIHNDRNLGGGACPGLPDYFQSGENMDCGEGIQLSGVDHSTITNNTVEQNAGGILIADDTGATHDNLITANLVAKNVPDCGITLASHSGQGVWHNTIAGNESTGNGGAGVGIFAPGPGTKDYANVILNNRLTDNGQTGIAMHNHAAPAQAPAVVFSDNVIVGNTIARNAPDTADAATAGPTGINIYSLAAMPGTVITQNTIDNEAIDLAIKVPSGTTAFEVHDNNLLNARNVGVLNAGGATVNAAENWWGCPKGPNSSGCSSAVGMNLIVTPWLTQPDNTHF